ncbi:hypothetical protein [Pararhizobium qamdonense]|uniref:hypothetical protein n=1 Tax=Pararhizobium qamdonense TaxID=3031126 RepID=UPI0023E2C06C|nr:hypothetical protein [Pararhizobium qamdonense]
MNFRSTSLALMLLASASLAACSSTHTSGRADRTSVATATPSAKPTSKANDKATSKANDKPSKPTGEVKDRSWTSDNGHRYGLHNGIGVLGHENRGYDTSKSVPFR